MYVKPQEQNAVELNTQTAVNRPSYSKNSNFIIALSALKFVCFEYYFLNLTSLIIVFI